MVSAFGFSVQSAPIDATSWVELARRCERDGFDALLAADHPGSASAPFVALAAAATATSRVRLGTYVVNAGAREPLDLAAEAATLDVVSGGRALLGVGAGHTPAEWSMYGRDYPPPGERVRRLEEVVEVTRRLLDGETVTFDGSHVRAVEARLAAPEPVQRPIPLLIGGNGASVLRYAAAHADVVAFSGLGRTLEDGHRHEVRWSPADIDGRVELARDAADQAGRAPRFEALVQHLEVTDDAEGVAARLTERVPSATAADILGAPYVLIGTVPEIVKEIRGHRERWGFDRYVVGADAIDAASEIMAALD